MASVTKQKAAPSLRQTVQPESHAQKPPQRPQICPTAHAMGPGNGNLSQGIKNRFWAISRRPSSVEKNKGGADAVGMGGRSPRRGSIRRAEGSDRGTMLVPAGDVCARRRRRQAGAPYFLSYPQNLLFNYRILYRFFI